jgi:hypothetical protein
MSFLDSITEKIESKLGAFDDTLETIVETQDIFLDSVSAVFEVMIQLLKIVIEILSNLAEAGPMLTLLIPAIFIIFVASKLSQIV